MPNATVRANARTLSRRLFLAAGPASAVFAALQGAAANGQTSASADAALFALVEEGKRQWKLLGDYCNPCDEVLAEREGREVLPEDVAARDEASEKYDAVFGEAMSTTPQTVAGARALLEWIERDCGGLALAEEHVHAVIASLLASPVLSQAT